MPHPLEEASKHANHVIKSFKCLIRRTVSTLKHAASRHQDFHEELSDAYDAEIENTLKEKWGAELEKLEQWKLSNNTETVWNTQQVSSCFICLRSGCLSLIKHWSSLTEACDTIEEKPLGSPSKQRYKERLESERKQIEEQLLSDIRITKDSYLNIKKKLNEAQIKEFHLNMIHEKIRLQQWPSHKDFASLANIEWIDIDFEGTPLEKISLQHCLFRSCHFGETPQQDLSLCKVIFLNCQGNLIIEKSRLEIEINSSTFDSFITNNSIVKADIINCSIEKVSTSTTCQIIQLNSSNSRGSHMSIHSIEGGTIAVEHSTWAYIELDVSAQGKPPYSLSLDKSRVRKLSLKGVTVNVFRSSHSYFLLQSINSCIDLMSDNNSQFNLCLHDSQIKRFTASETVAHVNSKQSNIENQTWSKSNAFILQDLASTQPQRDCSVREGKLERHRITGKNQCLIILDDNRLYKGSTNEALYAQIGRLLTGLSAPVLDEALMDNTTLFTFQYNQLLFLMKHKVPLSSTHLKSAIDHGPHTSTKSRDKIFHEGLMASFRKKILISIANNPTQSSSAIDSMDDKDTLFLLALLTVDSKTAPQEAQKQLSCVDLDNVLHQYFIETLSFIKTLDSQVKLIIPTNNQPSTTITQIATCVHNRIPALLKKRGKRRNAIVEIIQHLMGLGSWYLSIRDRSELLTSQLIHLLTEEDPLENPLLKQVKHILHTQCSVIAPQSLSLSAPIRENLTECRRNPFLKPYEEHLLSDSWPSLSHETLSDQFYTLTLHHASEILQRYRPLFGWHTTGQRKLGTIQFLLSLYREKKISPRSLVSRLYRDIEFLIGGRANQQSIRLLHQSLNLNRGRSRKKSGYLVTLQFTHHILKAAICDKSFHLPSHERCKQAKAFFKENKSAHEQAKAIVSSIAVSHIDSRFKEIADAVAHEELSCDTPLTDEQMTPLSLDQQLAASLLLQRSLIRVGSWSSKELQSFMMLWLHQQKRVNAHVNPIQSVRLVRGMCLKEFKPREARNTRKDTRKHKKGKSIELAC